MTKGSEQKKRMPLDLIFGHQDNMPSDIEVAYHEAGYTVMAYLSKRPFGTVSVQPNKRGINYIASSPTVRARDALGWTVAAWGHSSVK